MSFNLQEYILFRTDEQRELFNVEVDNNFKMVANPWIDSRTYEEGNIVYHPVEVELETGVTGEEGEQHLVWWRANKRTTRGVFLTSEWDLIGGIGTGDISIQGSDSFGKFLINSTVPAVWNGGSDVLIESTNPNDTLKLVAGPGMSIVHDQVTQSVRFDNLGATGEINNGINIGTGESVYSGMSGTDLGFYGFTASNTGSNILTISTTLQNNIEYLLNESAIDLSNLNLGSPTMDLLSDVTYSGLSNGNILYWVSGSNEWQAVDPNTLVSGSILFDSDSGIGSTHRIGNPAAVGDYSTVSGGSCNTAIGAGSVISGGGDNQASGVNSVIAGGQGNRALCNYSTVSGGDSNCSGGCASTISGGMNNWALETHTTIMGGIGNVVSAMHSSAVGMCNIVSGACSTISGGMSNSVSTQYSNISGGSSNVVAGSGSTIGGGQNNIAGGSNSIISGGISNCTSGANCAVISGGSNNTVSAIFGSISGGCNNTVSNACSHIVGHNITTVSDCTTHVNCMNIKDICSNAGVITSATLPLGTVYYNSSISALSIVVA